MTQALTITVIILSAGAIPTFLAWMLHGALRRAQDQNAELQKRIWLKRLAEGPAGVNGATAVAAAGELDAEEQTPRADAWMDPFPRRTAAQ